MKNFDDFKKEIINGDNIESIMVVLTSKIVGKLIAKRIEKGMSQRTLSEISDVPQKTISRIENGIDIPKLSTLVKLTKALDMEISMDVVDKN